MFKAAIIGRPNVGKSTLFNRLVGQKLALVDDLPGVTRDRREGLATLGDLSFTVIDTAGLEEIEDPAALGARMRGQTDRAIEEANLLLLVIDARSGITPLDRHFAEEVRRSLKPVVLVANKSEGRSGLAGAYEAFELGLGDPVALSAEHGEGMGDLFEAVLPYLPAPPKTKGRRRSLPDPAATDVSEHAAPPPAKPLLMAIVGRPNVGKSTLINRLLGEDRQLTGPEAGITRDSIGIDWVWRGRAVRLVDTAGLRRKARVEGKLERLSTSDSLRAIRFAELVVLVLDATDPAERQDLTIGRLIEDEGRAIIIAANKWDLVADPGATAADLAERLQNSLSQVAGIPVVPVSATQGSGLDKLMDAAFKTYEIWNRRVPTPRLNRWLAGVQERHPPPLVSGRRLRLRYMTQTNTRPPTFALFASKPGQLPEAYRRYLVNLLRQDFGLEGVPIRVMLRKGDNPYAKD